MNRYPGASRNEIHTNGRMDFFSFLDSGKLKQSMKNKLLMQLQSKEDEDVLIDFFLLLQSHVIAKNITTQDTFSPLFQKIRNICIPGFHLHIDAPDLYVSVYHFCRRYIEESVYRRSKEHLDALATESLLMDIFDISPGEEEEIYTKILETKSNDLAGDLPIGLRTSINKRMIVCLQLHTGNVPDAIDALYSGDGIPYIGLLSEIECIADIERPETTFVYYKEICQTYSEMMMPYYRKKAQYYIPGEDMSLDALPHDLALPEIYNKRR